MLCLKKKMEARPEKDICQEDQCGVDVLISQLRGCTNNKDFHRGRKLHVDIIRRGLLGKSIILGNALINMYAKFGALAKAWEIYESLPDQDVVSWNSLIAGYAQQGHCEKAAACFELMQQKGFCPNGVTFLSILKICCGNRLVNKGHEIHAKIVCEPLLAEEVALTTALVDMYGKCGNLARAKELFESLVMQDVIAWNALICGYSLYGHGDEALFLFKGMQQEGFAPDAITFSCILKACASIVAIKRGQEIHAKLAGEKLLERNNVVGTALVDMYAKCGFLDEAQNVFDELPQWNIISWNALIAGYAQYGYSEEALRCLERMEHGGICPDSVTFVSILKACADIQAINKGLEIHSEILKHGLLKKDTILGNALVDMYAKCGFLTKAKEVFDELPTQNVVSWNVLISGYVQNGHPKEALNCLEKMQIDGFIPNDVTFLSLLKACGLTGASEKGEEIHEWIKRDGLFAVNNEVGTAVIDMYVKCGLLEKALETFDGLRNWDVVSWTSLIAGCAEHGLYNEALRCFELLEFKDLCLDLVTLVCMLKVCANIGLIDKGLELHAKFFREGMFDEDVIVGTALVDMYAVCGFLLEARGVFDKLKIQDVAAWNALIAGYIQHGFTEEALNCFERMKYSGHSLDATTVACVLKASGSIGRIEKGLEIHSEIISKDSSLEKDVIVGTALVDMYNKCGMIAKAREVFDEIPTHNVITWNALISGYAHHECFEEALDSFTNMQLEGLFPDEVTFLSILKACGNIVAPTKGQDIHILIVKKGVLENGSVVGNMLVDMYAKCGMVAEAQDVFDRLQVQDVVSWNSMIAGYALLGEDNIVFKRLEKMVGEGKEPNSMSFTVILSTCSHAGQLEKAQMCLKLMSTTYGIFPALDHLACMIDLFGRAGQVEKTVAMVMDMPFCADVSVWNTVLGACQKRGDIELGILAFQHVIQLDPKDVASYVSLSNIFAAAGRIEDSEKVTAIVQGLGHIKTQMSLSF